MKPTIPTTNDAGPSSSSAPHATKKAPVPKTPNRNQQATSAPLKFMGNPKPRKSICKMPVAKPSPKQQPQKMQTANFPAALGPTKFPNLDEDLASLYNKAH
ncbi:hypothetical protein PGT21_013594 [Puccinia graminis f. sp. tritici]|uniref:Uncharacterized protein n=1 Tax=Puccinia graminis f. sp. tritici TaxID=56615 RepID=A0A5B0Q5H8_PUCGR|nr:hypothetical protein PGT21_013594 [Puccinia graminis f. sp. tritici]